MKAAIVNWTEDKIQPMQNAEAIMSAMEACLQQAAAEGATLLVFPALTGCLYQYLSQSCRSIEELKEKADCKAYLEKSSELCRKYGVALCPGSYWERIGGDVFHASCLITGGKIVLEQRQLYLARWERQTGLSRGVAAGLYEMDGWKVGIVLSTDVFYPQVSRLLAMKGADIILSPVALAGSKNEALQLSGMWQEAQQNLFFALESGYNGFLGPRSFWGESAIHAPLEMTEEEDGLLSKRSNGNTVIAAELDNASRKKAIRRFDVLSMLNPAFYRKMQGFGEVGENG